MTQEEKQLLLKDLCARLPYGVKLKVKLYDMQKDDKLKYRDLELCYGNICYCLTKSHWVDFKLYLRPMSSMTEEEFFNYKHLDLLDYSNDGFEMPNFRSIDWLNSHHFDYRGLIEKGLALEAPKEIYEKE